MRSSRRRIPRKSRINEKPLTGLDIREMSLKINRDNLYDPENMICQEPDQSYQSYQPYQPYQELEEGYERRMQADMDQIDPAF